MSTLPICESASIFFVGQTSVITKFGAQNALLNLSMAIKTMVVFL
jgi:hypothetical protein